MNILSLFKKEKAKAIDVLADAMEANAEATRTLMHAYGRTPNKRGSNAIDELQLQIIQRHREKTWNRT